MRSETERLMDYFITEEIEYVARHKLSWGMKDLVRRNEVA